MKTLNEILKDKMTERALSPITKSRLATLMIYLQDYMSLPFTDQQKMKDLILDFVLYKWSDRSILTYMEVEAQDLAEELEPLDTDVELADTLLGKRLWEAMEDYMDDFTANTQIITEESNVRKRMEFN